MEPAPREAWSEVIGILRVVLACTIIALATVPMVLAQLAAGALGLNLGLLPHLWHRLAARLLGLHVHVHGALTDRRPLLVVSNHVSWIDIVVLGALAPLSFVAKAEVRGWPIFGIFARLQRSIFIERERRGMSKEQAGEIAARMGLGDPIVLFAEGSTGDGNFLLPFKSTLFGAAQMVVSDGGRGRAWVQPVAIAYTRFHGMPMNRLHRPRAAWIGDQVLLPHAAELLREGGVDVEVRFGEPVEIGAGADRKALARQVEARVQAMFGQALRGETDAK